MKKEIHPISLRLNSKSTLLGWCQDDVDYLLNIDKKELVKFDDIKAFLNYKSATHTPVDADPLVYDLDVVSQWIDDNIPDCIDYNKLLDVWNLFGDIAYSCSYDFKGNSPAYNKIYGKLFYGCNLESVTPEGHKYEPIWNDSERKKICKVLRVGLDICCKLNL